MTECLIFGWGIPFFIFIVSMTIESIKEQVIGGKPANEEQAVFLTECPDKESLYQAAHEITCACMGNKFDTCSIINAKSGNCSEDCKWCAQSSFYKTNVELYPLLPLAVLSCVLFETVLPYLGLLSFQILTVRLRSIQQPHGQR